MLDIRLSSTYSFQIAIDNITDSDELFYSIEGLSMFYNLLPQFQGGENNETMVTSTLKTSPLIVKRPLTNIVSGFSKWCIDTLNTGTFQPVSMNIFILNYDSEINNHWIAEEAYPYGMKISPINIDNDKPVIMEEIHVLYRKLRRLK